jgi:hypothetical protein
MGLNMTIETALAIVVGASWGCYLVWKWQEAVVDLADPPYQAPVEAAKAEVKAELDTQLNPKAAWPFPSGDKP